MTPYIQKSFIGGLNQQIDSTRLEGNEYALLINGRNRYDVIAPIKLPLEIVSDYFTNQNIQGLYSVGSIVIVFANGKAFYKDQNNPAANWNQIADFQMSVGADILYAELVPTSSINYTRVPKINGQVNTDILLVTPINASPAGLIVQDGETQPWIILPNMTARQLKTYNQWSIEDREYVPIGKQMLYSNGILYVVNGPNILRSVTGRPTDFVVSIDTNGDKLPDEADGGAVSVSFSVDYDNITCIAKLATDDGSFFVSTIKAAYAVTPLVEPEDLIYGEPDYTARFLFSAGATSPFSFVEMIGDNAFVDFNGLRSFNAILQLKNEGKNSPFSKKIGPLIQGIFQDYTAAINFDNYALFAVNTIYGRGIVVYDTLNEIFTSIDLYPNIGQILKFEVVRTTTENRLFFVTVDGKFYEAFANDDYATCKLYLGDWCSNDPNIEAKPYQLKLVFVDATQSGTVTASIYSDRKLGGSLTDRIEKIVDGENPLNLVTPIGESPIDSVSILNFDFTKKGELGWKHGFLITWDINTKLTHAKFNILEDPSIHSVTQQAVTNARNKAALNNLNL